MSVRLALSHLGTVEISVDRDAASAAVKISTDQKDTLDALMSDQDSLRSILQQSGMTNPSSTIQFTMLGGGESRESGGFQQQTSDKRRSDDRRGGLASTKSSPDIYIASLAEARLPSGNGCIDITA